MRSEGGSEPLSAETVETTRVLNDALGSPRGRRVVSAKADKQTPIQTDGGVVWSTIRAGARHGEIRVGELVPGQAADIQPLQSSLLKG